MSVNYNDMTVNSIFEIVNQLSAVDKKTQWLKSDLSTVDSSFLSRVFWCVAKHFSFLRSLYGIDHAQSFKNLSALKARVMELNDAGTINCFQTAVLKYNSIASRKFLIDPIIFEAEGQDSFAIEKDQLLKLSPHYQRMFGLGCQETTSNTIKLDISSEAAKIFIHYLKSGKTDTSTDIKVLIELVDYLNGIEFTDNPLYEAILNQFEGIEAVDGKVRMVLSEGNAKLLQSSIKDKITSLDLSNFINFENTWVIDSVKDCKNLTEICVLSVAAESLKEIVVMPSIKSIIVDVSLTPTFESFTKAVGFANLREDCLVSLTHLENVAHPDVINMYTFVGNRLASINFTNNNSITSRSLHNLCDVCRNVESLILDSCPNLIFNYVDIRYIENKFKKIHINNTQFYKGCYFGSFNKLTELKVTNCKICPNDMSFPPSLKKLDLSTNSLFSIFDISIFPSMPHVTHLNLNGRVLYTSTLKSFMTNSAYRDLKQLQYKTSILVRLIQQNEINRLKATLKNTEIIV